MTIHLPQNSVAAVRVAQRVALQELHEKWIDEVEQFAPGDERRAYRKAFARALSNATRVLQLETP